MTKLSLKFIVAVAAIVCASIIIGIGVLSITRINRLNDEILALNSRITQLNNNDNTTQSKLDNLKNEIEKQLQEQSRNYFDLSHQILELDNQNNTATVQIYFSLKESPVSADVEVSFRKGNQYEEIAATKLTNGKYTAELELQMDKDYEISYSATLTTVKTEKLIEINVLEQLTNRFNSSAYFYSVNRSNWNLDFYLYNSYSQNDNLKISTAILEVFKDNAVIKTVNIKNYIIKNAAGYDQYGGKDIELSELPFNDFIDDNVYTKITVVDNCGIVYTLGNKHFNDA